MVYLPWQQLKLVLQRFHKGRAPAVSIEKGLSGELPGKVHIDFRYYEPVVSYKNMEN
jgi:hypothetical protein